MFFLKSLISNLNQTTSSVPQLPCDPVQVSCQQLNTYQAAIKIHSETLPAECSLKASMCRHSALHTYEDPIWYHLLDSLLSCYTFTQATKNSGHTESAIYLVFVAIDCFYFVSTTSWAYGGWCHQSDPWEVLPANEQWQRWIVLFCSGEFKATCECVIPSGWCWTVDGWGCWISMAQRGCQPLPSGCLRSCHHSQKVGIFPWKVDAPFWNEINARKEVEQKHIEQVWSVG